MIEREREGERELERQMGGTGGSSSRQEPQNPYRGYYHAVGINVWKVHRRIWAGSKDREKLEQELEMGPE